MGHPQIRVAFGLRGSACDNEIVDERELDQVDVRRVRPTAICRSRTRR